MAAGAQQPRRAFDPRRVSRASASSRASWTRDGRVTLSLRARRGALLHRGARRCPCRGPLGAEAIARADGPALAAALGRRRQLLQGCAPAAVVVARRRARRPPPRALLEALYSRGARRARLHEPAAGAAAPALRRAGRPAAPPAGAGAARRAGRALLVPVGGGKDSAVAIEIVRRSGAELRCSRSATPRRSRAPSRPPGCRACSPRAARPAPVRAATPPARSTATSRSRRSSRASPC